MEDELAVADEEESGRGVVVLDPLERPDRLDVLGAGDLGDPLHLAGGIAHDLGDLGDGGVDDAFAAECDHVAAFDFLAVDEHAVVIADLLPLLGDRLARSERSLGMADQGAEKNQARDGKGAFRHDRWLPVGLTAVKTPE